MKLDRYTIHHTRASSGQVYKRRQRVIFLVLIFVTNVICSQHLQSTVPSGKCKRHICVVESAHDKTLLAWDVETKCDLSGKIERLPDEA